MNRIFKYAPVSALLLTSIASNAAQFTVLDAANTPLKNVVVVVEGAGGVADASSVKEAQMSQQDRQFSPHILAVQRGTAVTFPNKDDIAHHVFSFSDAKKFQTKVYKDEAQSPVVFEKTGVVELGCNVHDWMIGYIYVADSKHFAMTDETGKASIKLPKNGQYKVKVWHPLMEEGELAARSLSIVDKNTIKLSTKLKAADDFDIDDLGVY